jgi:hypothetical protein
VHKIANDPKDIHFRLPGEEGKLKWSVCGPLHNHKAATPKATSPRQLKRSGIQGPAQFGALGCTLLRNLNDAYTDPTAPAAHSSAACPSLAKLGHSRLGLSVGLHLDFQVEVDFSFAQLLQVLLHAHGDALDRAARLAHQNFLYSRSALSLQLRR